MDFRSIFFFFFYFSYEFFISKENFSRILENIFIKKSLHIVNHYRRGRGGGDFGPTIVIVTLITATVTLPTNNIATVTMVTIKIATITMVDFFDGGASAGSVITGGKNVLDA